MYMVPLSSKWQVPFDEFWTVFDMLFTSEFSQELSPYDQ